jgi:hypothetical protein
MYKCACEHGVESLMVVLDHSHKGGKTVIECPPNANIKLVAQDQQRIFNVFLHDDREAGAAVGVIHVIANLR